MSKLDLDALEAKITGLIPQWPLPGPAEKAMRSLIAEVERLLAERNALKEANGILEDALQEAGDDYPGSNMQEWCQQQVKAARRALEAKP